jgi:hypothetical protein
MRTEIRVENVETLVRLAVEHMSRLEAHVQANNGKRGLCSLSGHALTNPLKMQNTQSLKKSFVSNPKGLLRTVSISAYSVKHRVTSLRLQICLTLSSLSLLRHGKPIRVEVAHPTLGWSSSMRSCLGFMILLAPVSFG